MKFKIKLKKKKSLLLILIKKLYKIWVILMFKIKTNIR